MPSNYRRADMIELHDAQLTVHVEGFPQDVNWLNAPTVNGARLSVDGSGLAHLLEAIGVTFDANHLYGSEFDVLFRQPAPAEDRASESLLSDVPRINELRARPDGAELLHIHMTLEFGEEGEEYVQELTYAGHYTVWWSVAEE